MQKLLEVQESRSGVVTPERRTADQAVPFQVRNCPSSAMARQKREPRHSISTRPYEVNKRIGEDHVLPFHRRTSPDWNVKQAVVEAHSTGQWGFMESKVVAGAQEPVHFRDVPCCTSTVMHHVADRHETEDGRDPRRDMPVQVDPFHLNALPT